MEQLELAVTDESRKYVDDWAYAETKGIVQSGPFKGMWLPREQAWVDGALSPMLLGCHEQELHEALEGEINRLEKLDNPKIVNIGCAEGYYAVGLARRLPKATVWALDSEDACLDIARKAADANKVKLVMGDVLTNVLAAPDLVVSDCEAAEVVYLDYEKFPGLLRSVIIVETHLLSGPVLMERFGNSHDIMAYREGPRDPNCFIFIRDRSSLFRWMMVCENRPTMMVWFVMTPKQEIKIYKTREDWVWEKNEWRPR